MKKTKIKPKIIIITSILFIIIIVVITLGIVNGSKKNTENINIIKDNYQSLIDEIANYNTIRSDYIELSKNFYLETYDKNHDKYLDILTKYNENIKKIDNTINNLLKPCEKIYKNKDINKICSSYHKTYEKVINLYVSDLLTYNENITKYNTYKNLSIDKFKMIHSDYIDYNHDGIYEGKNKYEED